jgi:hypothetical protein
MGMSQVDKTRSVKATFSGRKGKAMRSKEKTRLKSIGMKASCLFLEHQSSALYHL